MKTNNLLQCILFISISLFTFSTLAQTSQVNWSAFSSGFGLSNSINSLTISAAGQSFAGTSINGDSKVISGFLAYTSTIVTDVSDEQEIIPTVYKLNQNYPNPFNPSTVISWQLPVSSHVLLKIYDILGNEVAILVNENKETGYYETRFDGSALASGMYIYRLTAGNYISTKKMLMIK
jgi:hypothetical protein